MDRLPRFYKNPIELNNERITLDDDQVGHITSSLRLQLADEVVVFDGVDSKYLCSIEEITRRKVTLKVNSTLQINKGYADITLIQALPKAKKMNLIINKLTEIGVKRIIPLETRYSILKKKDIEKKYDRFEKLIIESCKQSERDVCLELSPPITIDQLPVQSSDNELRIIASTKNNPISINEALKLPHKKITYIIGPEGDFTDEELELAHKAGFMQVSLGANILRTETAAIYLASVLAYRIHDQT